MLDESFKRSQGVARKFNEKWPQLQVRNPNDFSQATRGFKPRRSNEKLLKFREHNTN